MLDAFADKLAHVLTNYSIPIEKGEYVVINGPAEAAPLMDALTAHVLMRGGYPHLNVVLPNTNEIFMEYASDDQLKFNDPANAFYAKNLDVTYRIYAPTNTRAGSSIDPKRAALAQEGVKDFLDIYRKRRAANELRWCVCPWPTMSGAQEAEMGLMAYTQFVYESCGLDHDDPVAYWQEFRDRQLRYVDWLDGKKHMQVRGPGIDIEFSIEGRTWVSAHGEVNFPDGEIFTGPVEESVNGVVDFNFPTVYQGREVNGVHFEFKDGKVVDASATKGEEFLFSKLDHDAGARFLGEFAIGTNWGVKTVYS